MEKQGSEKGLRYIPDTVWIWGWGWRSNQGPHRICKASGELRRWRADKNGKPGDYFERQEKLGGPVNTYTGELYFTAHRGTYTSQAAIKKWNRKTELALRDLELWATVAAAGGEGYVYPSETIERLWKETLTNQFHDILPGSSIGRVYEEAERSLEHVCEEAGQLQKLAISTLAEEGEGITVLNALSFPRICLVEVPETYKDGCLTLEGEEAYVYQD